LLDADYVRPFEKEIYKEFLESQQTEYQLKQLNKYHGDVVNSKFVKNDEVYHPWK